MYPHERSLAKQLADKPFALIGVNSDSDLEEIREIVKKKNLTWRSFQNEQDYGDISDLWGIRGWPTIFLLDAEGTIRYRNLRGSEMDEAIEELLGEMGHEVKIVHEKKSRKKRKERNAEESDEAAELDESDDGDDDPQGNADDATDAEKAEDKGDAEESEDEGDGDAADKGGESR